jgi:hypothetical protein
MKHSAAGERFQFKYVMQSLKDWKTWVASEHNTSTHLTLSLLTFLIVGIYMGLLV